MFKCYPSILEHYCKIRYALSTAAFNIQPYNHVKIFRKKGWEISQGSTKICDLSGRKITDKSFNNPRTTPVLIFCIINTFSIHYNFRTWLNTHKHLNRKILGISQEYRWNFLDISQTLILAKAVGVTESLHLGRQPALKIVATIFNIVPPPSPFSSHPLLSSIVYFFHRRSPLIKKLIMSKLPGMPKIRWQILGPLMAISAICRWYGTPCGERVHPYTSHQCNPVYFFYLLVPQIMSMTSKFCYLFTAAYCVADHSCPGCKGQWVSIIVLFVVKLPIQPQLNITRRLYTTKSDLLLP